MAFLLGGGSGSQQLADNSSAAHAANIGKQLCCIAFSFHPFVLIFLLLVFIFVWFFFQLFCLILFVLFCFFAFLFFLFSLHFFIDSFFLLIRYARLTLCCIDIVFDLLYVNDDSVMELELTSRIELLHRCIPVR